MRNTRVDGRWLRACAALALVACGVLGAAQARGPASAVASAATAGEVRLNADGIEVRSGAALLRVDAIGERILRVRVSRDGVLPEDASWAVPAPVRAARVRVQPLAGGAGFATGALRVRVQPGTLRLRVEDAQERTVLEDQPRAVAFDGAAFEVRKRMPAGERYFGLGDKTGPLDRRGGAFVHWNTDVGRFGEATDPLYKSIPFFVAIGGAAGSYGLFLDNTWRSWFDFGRRTDGVLAFGADGGPLDYYLIHGPDIPRVVAGYTTLTGRAPLPPLWALGYQQSRYSYASSREVRELAARLRAERIPTDVVWLDIGFQDRNRPFTADPRAYPDLPRLASDLRAQGLRLVAITDPHIAHAPGEDYAPYDSGAAGDHFVHRRDGSVYVGEVWPGASVFPDFTRAATRTWWGGLYRDFAEAGIAGFWNDMNEPAVFNVPGKTMPADAVHRIDTPGFAPRVASHAEIHNVYGMQNTRATFEGLQALRPDERPFVMTRASYAGGQRYAATWTGDNSSSWSHLKLAVAQTLNLGLSGFAYVGADVGGFTGGASPELMTRWFQVGAFLPLFRNHSAIDAPRAEPWVDGPRHTALRRSAIEARYRLLPYLYALADEHARSGAPLARPVFYEDPAALSLPCDQSMAFLLGRALLVAASPTPESPQSYRVCLPAGGWFDYWSGLAVAPVDAYDGTVRMETPSLERLPVFVRAGTILPRQPLVQSTAETPRGPLTLDVYPGPDCAGVLYADDGESLAYARGEFLRQRLRCSVRGDGIELVFEPREGGFTPWWTRIEVVVHGWRGDARVAIDGRAIAPTTGAGTQVLRFGIDAPTGASTVSIRRPPR